MISRGTQGVAPDDLEPVKFRNITFYSSLYQDSKAWLEERGIDLSSHISTPIDGEVAEHASVLFAMDRKTQKALLTLYPDHAIKVHLLSELVGDDREIIDPECVSGRQKQEQIFTEIENRIVEGFPRLLVLTDSVNKTTREATGNQPEGISPRREKWI